jgi:hypothetical protein
MSTVQVAEQIKKTYSVGPSAETIRREVRKGQVGDPPAAYPVAITGICAMPKVLAWKGIVDKNRHPPLLSRWTEADERKLAEASVTTVTIGHTALRRMVAMKKKELVLAAATMLNEEFEVLRRDWERREQITDQESSAPTEEKLVTALETSVDATTEGTEGSL